MLGGWHPCRGVGGTQGWVTGASSQEIKCLDHQVQPHRMLREGRAVAPWHSRELCFLDFCTDKTCLSSAAAEEQGATQPGCYLRPAACWCSFALQPAAALGSSRCAEPKLPATELSSGRSWVWGTLYFKTAPVSSPRYCDVLTRLIFCGPL